MDKDRGDANLTDHDIAAVATDPASRDNIRSIRRMGIQEDIADAEEKIRAKRPSRWGWYTSGKPVRDEKTVSRHTQPIHRLTNFISSNKKPETDLTKAKAPYYNRDVQALDTSTIRDQKSQKKQSKQGNMAGNKRNIIWRNP
jgi:hypothetical protein